MSTETHFPLTKLSEDERMFFSAVADFAKREISPRVLRMDETETMDPDLITKLFEQGIMGIEVPEKFGGAGSTFLMRF